MNLTTDKKNNPKGKVYLFYGAIICLSILALWILKLNIYAKAVFCTLILLCFAIMRSVKSVAVLPPDIDPDTMQKVEPLTTSESAIGMANVDIEEAEYVEIEDTDKSTVNSSSSGNAKAIDRYLSLLIETDEELSKDPSFDTSSPGYMNMLNHRIAEKLDAMSQNRNQPSKD